MRREEGGGRRGEEGVGSDAQVLTLLIVTPLQALTLRTHARACSEVITYEGRKKQSEVPANVHSKQVFGVLNNGDFSCLHDTNGNSWGVSQTQGACYGSY